MRIELKIVNFVQLGLSIIIRFQNYVASMMADKTDPDEMSHDVSFCGISYLDTGSMAYKGGINLIVIPRVVIQNPKLTKG